MGIKKDSERAIDFGKEAFARGAIRNCYADPAWTALLKSHTEGKPARDCAAHRALMRLGMSWYRGWDLANLAAPVVDVS